MLQGTGSDVGKSILATALCRVFRQDGHCVAPFKAQNMALNSFVTKDGGEMGRAQVVQAQAAMIEPRVEMNPVLLKPTGVAGSQVIVLGRPVGVMSAAGYHGDYAARVFPFVEKALSVLADEYELLVIEGAGSPAEINLKASDIVNMRIAKYLNAPVLLVADIDRGGALASIVGTLALFDEEERALVKGFIINKFRGDVNILRPALDFLREKTGVPVLGVLDYIDSIDIDDEDSVALDKKSGGGGDLRVAVIRLPKISNFTDFAALEAEEDVNVAYVRETAKLGDPDLIIIPGSKNTTEDLLFLKNSGLESQIVNLNKKGVPVLGICGGYQMLGEQLKDPEHTESAISQLAGLALLPVATVFTPEKVTRQVTAAARGNNFLRLDFSADGLVGYEIHMGRSEYTKEATNAFWVDRGAGAPAADGAVRDDGLVMGTYLHGLFDNDCFRRAVIDKLRAHKGLPAKKRSLNAAERRERAYDRLARLARARLDFGKIYEIIGLAR
jgi:adenosylcobyric acid synthase